MKPYYEEGGITIYNADCLDVMREMEDKSVDLVLTDPPYGTTQNKWDSIINLKDMWKEINRVTKHNGSVVMTATQPFSSVLVSSNIANFKYEWVWVKDNGTGFLNAKKQPLRNNESILVFYNKQPTYNPQMRQGEPYRIKSGATKSSNYGSQIDVHTACDDGLRYPLTVVKFTRDKSKVHPTQKPVALMEYLIKTYTNEGETVLDFTMGSGTTGVACVNTNRDFIGIELNEEYYKIAEKRISQITERLL